MAKKSKAQPTVKTTNFQAADYAGKYQFDTATGSVQPKNGHSPVPEHLKAISFMDEGDGKFSALIPRLSGGVSYTEANASITTGFDYQELVRISQRGKNDDKYNMRLAIEYWKVDPLVFKCTKVLTQLANSKLTVQCTDGSAKSLIENWLNQAMPFSFRQAWFREFFRSSMVPSLKTLVEYVPRDFKDGKIPTPGEGGNIEVTEMAQATSAILDRRKTETKEFKSAMETAVQVREQFAMKLCSQERLEMAEKALAAKQHIWIKGMIPGAYTIMDPMSIDIKGPSDVAWLREPYLKVANEVIEAVKNPTPQQMDALDHMPVEIVQQIRAGKNEVWLSPNICQVTFGEKQPYEKYPSPISSHAFRALQIKHEMMEADRCGIKQLRDRILKVTIGSDQLPCTDANQIKALAAMFTSRNQSMTMFWDHTLKIEWVQPEIEHLINNTKYDLWNDEIRTAYGINKVFTGTESKGSTGGDILNLKGVVEEVTEAQQRYIEFLNQEIKLLKASLGISAAVWFTFDSLNLRNENDYMAVVMQMVQNGLIDVETALETMGWHFPTVETRMKAQQKLREKGLFMPTPSANNMGPDGIATPGGGKPKGLAGPASNNKNKLGKPQPKTKPNKAMATLASTKDGESFIVLDVEELDIDYVQSIASFFNMEPEQVVTRDAFIAAHGDVAFAPQVPQLTLPEMLRAIKDGQGLYAHVVAKQEDLITSDIKTRGEGKAKYRTKKLEEEKLAQALAIVMGPIRPAAVKDEWWNIQVKANRDDLAAANTIDNHDELDVIASTVTAARFAKLASKAA